MKNTLILAGIFLPVLAASAADKAPYKVSGVYTETCACSIPCKCELTGDVPSICQGAGAYAFTAGSYAGADVSGVKVAYALKPGEWVRLYIDAPDKAHRDAAEKLARVMFAGFGPVEAVKDGKIAITGSGGNYHVTVDDGKVMTYDIEPVIGGDGKTALTHGNTHNTVTPTFYQAKSKSLTYHDDNRTIELAAGRNGYFNEHVDSSGSL